MTKYHIYATENYPDREVLAAEQECKDLEQLLGWIKVMVQEPNATSFQIIIVPKEDKR